jgi:hypothetical protein
LKVGDRVLLSPPPVRESLAAGAANLISKEFDDTLVYAVVVRLDNAFTVFVVEPKQSFLFYCCPDEWIDVQFWFR